MKRRKTGRIIAAAAVMIFVASQMALVTFAESEGAVPQVPQTGDSHSVVPYIVLLVLAIVAGVVVAVTERKNRDAKR